MSRQAERARRIVALGGGTGLHALLRGLHQRGDELCALITVADDGGSSGRLRKDFAIPPPGDIRNCLVALSDADPILGELFQYRFEQSVLKGHAFGNLFIAVLARLSGDFRGAIERARALLGVRGRVIPSTDQMVVLVAEHPDGTKSTGETAISASDKPIDRIRLVPRPPRVSAEIAEVIENADLVILGPGSLYTSIVPNLLVPGMIELLNQAKAKVLLVSNLMTQPGETGGFDFEDHLKALQSLDGDIEIDMVLTAMDQIGPNRIHRYAEAGAEPVRCPAGVDTVRGVTVHRAKIIEHGERARHDPGLLAEAIHECFDRLTAKEEPTG